MALGWFGIAQENHEKKNDRSEKILGYNFGRARFLESPDQINQQKLGIFGDIASKHGNHLSEIMDFFPPILLADITKKTRGLNMVEPVRFHLFCRKIYCRMPINFQEESTGDTPSSTHGIASWGSVKSQQIQHRWLISSCQWGICGRCPNKNEWIHQSLLCSF